MSPRQSLQNLIELHEKANQLEHEAAYARCDAEKALRDACESDEFKEMPMKKWVQVDHDKICRISTDGSAFKLEYDCLTQPPAATTEE
ncbi:MAG: hypothetical protein F6J87_18235 [Spirulina sp. SIO3F2]|nr:hypothetical protein [Spirulina sp. SIO3F2]